MICMVYWFKILRDGARHFSNQCDIYQAAKVVPKNWSDNHCNWSGTRPSMLLLELY